MLGGESEKPSHQSLTSTPLMRQLQLMCDDCVLRKNMYWRMCYNFQRHNNYVSIPLLVLSSITGLTSVSQVSSDTANPTVLWVTAATGTLSTFIAALQRYLRFGERGEQCKILAKRYADLARKIDIKLDQFNSGALPEWGIKELGQFAEEMVQEFAKLLNETQDIDLKELDKESLLNDTPTPHVAVPAVAVAQSPSDLQAVVTEPISYHNEQKN